MSFTLDEARLCVSNPRDLDDLNRLYPNKNRLEGEDKARWKVLEGVAQKAVDGQRMARYNMRKSAEGAPPREYTYSTNWLNVAALVAAVAIVIGTIALVASVAMSLGAIGVAVGVGLLLAGCAVDGYYAYSFVTDKDFSILN